MATWVVATPILFDIHPETWGRFPFWLIFFKGVETTNQLLLKHYVQELRRERQRDRVDMGSYGCKPY